MQRLLTKNKTWIFSACVLALIFLLFFVPSFSAGVKSLTSKTLLFSAKFCSGIGQYFRSKTVLLEENKFLHKKIGDLSLEISQLRELRNENKRLRSLLRFKRRAGFDTISAEVIARNPNNWIGSFVINRGTADGIRRDAAVCSAEGLLGRVAEAGENTSSVMLITHPAFKTGGMLRNTRINGVVVGAGKGMAKILYLPIDAKVSKGTLVVTSGFSRIFPKGIVIGEIVSVHRSKTGLYKYAMIKLAANPFDQEEVLCIK